MIDPKRMVAISLPMEEWHYLVALVLEAPASHQPRAKIVTAMQGQFRAIEERDDEPRFTGDAVPTEPPASDPPPQPTASRAAGRRRTK